MNSTATHYFYNIYKAWIQYIKLYLTIQIKSNCRYQTLMLTHRHTCHRYKPNLTEVSNENFVISALFIWGLATISPPLKREKTYKPQPNKGNAWVQQKFKFLLTYCRIFPGSKHYLEAAVNIFGCRFSLQVIWLNQTMINFQFTTYETYWTKT